MSKLHQIYDEDLATLERELPELAEALSPHMNNRLRIKIRTVQQILLNVRWKYGPHGDGEIIAPEVNQDL